MFIFSISDIVYILLIGIVILIVIGCLVLDGIEKFGRKIQNKLWGKPNDQETENKE